LFHATRLRKRTLREREEQKILTLFKKSVETETPSALRMSPSTAQRNPMERLHSGSLFGLVDCSDITTAGRGVIEFADTGIDPICFRNQNQSKVLAEDVMAL